MAEISLSTGQEPRSLCSFAKEERMQAAYQEKRDLYAEIGAACFHNKYEDNLEHNPVTGELNPEGKARRSSAKCVFLGTLYGMGPKTLAEKMNLSLAEASKIIEDFYNGFPGIKRFTEESQDMLRKCGYITDIFGRRRHIPDGALDNYTLTYIGEDTTFNPFIGAKSHQDDKVVNLLNKYKQLINNAYKKEDKQKITEKALTDNIIIKDNKGFISRALRQCLNARIQGSAASMTKLAMVKIVNDQKLKDLGFRILISVHDEIIGEAPRTTAKEAGERLAELMVEAAKDKCSYTPWSVDAYNCTSWYVDECVAEVLKAYKKLGDVSIDEAVGILSKKFEMCDPQMIRKVIINDFDESSDSLKRSE